MADAFVWLVGNTMRIQLGSNKRPLRDPDTGAVITTATVQAWVRDAKGTTVTGDVFPKALAHVGGGAGLGDGVYRGSVSYQAALVEAQRGSVLVRAEINGVRYEAIARIEVRNRTGAGETS